MVALGHFGTDDDLPCLAFGTGKKLARHCLQAKSQYLAGRLAGVVPDGAHECLRVKGMPLYLQQGFFPTAGQFHIRHAHILHRLVDKHSFFGRYDTFA